MHLLYGVETISINAFNQPRAVEIFSPFQEDIMYVYTRNLSSGMDLVL
jgi:hypothetical protein